MEVNVHEAKTNLSRLIVRAEAGEEVIIARAGKPAVRLVPVHSQRRKFFKPGALKGKLTVPDNFLEPDTEMERLFYQGPLFPQDAEKGKTLRMKVAKKRAPSQRPETRVSGHRTPQR